MVERRQPPWEALEHAYGPAVEVPDWLLGLRDPTRSSRCLDELFGAITHQGSRYSATPWTIPYLVDVAADPSSPNRAHVLGLIHFSANGFIGDHLDWRRQRDAQADGDERASWEAVAGERARLRPLLTDLDGSVAQIALAVLVWSGDASAAVLDAIAGGAGASDDAVVGASHLAATVLGRLPDELAAPTRPVGPGPIAAFGSSVAALRFAGAGADDACVETLRRTFESPTAGDEVVCDFLLGEVPSRWAAIALGRVPEHLRASTIVRLTTDVARGFVTGVEPLVALLRLVLRDARAPASAAELPDDAIAPLTALAGALETWGEQRPWELADVGLPATRESLLAWLERR